MAALVQGLRRALSGKGALLSGAVAGTDCFRLCAGAADGCEGLIVDRFGSLVVATAYASAPAGAGARLLTELRCWFPSFDVIVKSRIGSGEGDLFAIDRSVLARDQPLVATERGLSFEIGTNPAHDFGVYLDAAKARLHVRATSRHRHVLNLFSYAGAFGIAAAAGAAASVTNVDPNKEYLAWSLRNAQLNGTAMRVLPDTAQAFLRKHLRRLVRSAQTMSFDLVVIDPPAFGVGRGNERLLRLLWPELFAALRTMAPRQIVLMCNDKYFRSRKSFPDVVSAELGSRYRFTRLGTHLTIADVEDGPDLRWKPGVEDAHYVEPVVLAGTLID